MRGTGRICLVGSQYVTVESNVSRDFACVEFSWRRYYISHDGKHLYCLKKKKRFWRFRSVQIRLPRGDAAYFTTLRRGGLSGRCPVHATRLRHRCTVLARRAQNRSLAQIPRTCARLIARTQAQAVDKQSLPHSWFARNEFKPSAAPFRTAQRRYEPLRVTARFHRDVRLRLKRMPALHAGVYAWTSEKFQFDMGGQGCI